MAKQLLTPSLKNYSCKLVNLTGTVGKVELIPTSTTAVCESWNVSDKYTWDNVGDLNPISTGRGVFHVNFVCLLITFLVLGRLPPNLVTFHNWVLAKFLSSKIKNRRFLVAMVSNLSRVVFAKTSKHD